MITKTIYLNDDKSVYFNAYLYEQSDEMPYSKTRPAVVVCPGGGYRFCSSREADPVALNFAAAGYNTFVLYYSIKEKAVFPTSLIDLCKTMKIIRENADEWGVKKDQIAVCGFSAGGHLTASLGTYWSDPKIQELSGCEHEENKPNAIILGYPVISTSWLENSESDAKRLVGDNDYDTVYNALNLHKNVNKNNPPAFIFHTFRDNAVPVEDSILFGKAMCDNNIPFEMHIYPNGWHGLSLGTAQVGHNEPDFNNWVPMCINWLERLFTNPDEANAPINRAPYLSKL